MKTNLTLLLVIISTFSYSQISITERKSNYIYYNKKETKAKLTNTTDETKKHIYSFDLKNFKKTISDKGILNALNSQIKINNIYITDSSSVKLNTNDVADFKKISQEVVTEITELTPESELTDTSKDTYYYGYYENKLEQSKSDLNTLEKSKNTINNDFKKLKELKSKIEKAKDSVSKYDKIIEDFDSINLKNSKENKWLPSMEKNQRADFYNNLYSKDSKASYLLNNVSAQIGNNSAAISSELIASYIDFLRVSFGTLITSSDETKENSQNRLADTQDETTEADETNAFQRLLSSGGGNLYLNIDLPILYLQSKTKTLYFNANAKSGVVLTQFSKDVDTTTGNGNVGFNLYGSIATNDQKSFIFFLNSNFGGYGGGTDFYSKLNLKENKVFAFGQVTLGLDIAKSIRVSYTLGSFGSDENLRTKRGVVGIQLLKGLFD